MHAHAQDHRWSDVAVAVLLAALLTCAWTWRDWGNLSALRLPDTDDVVRLQQIRDWLSGQGFSDLTQHRLGISPGLQMHWSRLPDVIPGAVIHVLTPALGVHQAELTAVIIWPAMLFTAALLMIASVARTLGVSAPLTVVLAALAYPATTLFVPARIDHHGLQMVLLLVVLRAVLGRASLGWGAAAGLASMASFAIGLETAPLLAVCGIVIAVQWIRKGTFEQPRLTGYAATLVLSLVAGAGLLRTTGWTYPACDAFDAETWRVGQCAALILLCLSVYGFVRPELRARITGAALAAAAFAIAIGTLGPHCLHPYGGVDPLLARLWLANVAEAQPLFGAPAANAIGYAGLVVVGAAATLWLVRSGGDRRWLILLALQIAAVAITLAQLRGAYAGALLAAPPLAALITSARTRGPAFLIPAWLISAGLIYPMLGNAATPSHAGAGEAQADCTGPRSLERLAALPHGTLMAPIDLGAFALAATPHRVIAAPYHRNGAGNAAMYRFFLGSADHALAEATKLHLTYVAICPGDFGGLRSQTSLADQLLRATPPTWLRPISSVGESPLIFIVERRP